MKKTAVCMFVCTILLITIGVQPVYADQPEPEPLIPPAEINVTPYSQTVFAPDYHAVWETGIWGIGDNYCIEACWGDPCGCARSCGYVSGTIPYAHYFQCGGSSPFYQTWTLYNGPGSPVQDFTVVYK